MNVLHYSLSLSACPKCHLFICKHTSLADFDLNFAEQQQSITECNNTQVSLENKLEKSHQQCLLHGTNFYIIPSATNDSNRHSWTTFGTDSIESTNTFHNLSSNNETIRENISFANENIINSLLPSTINQNASIQSEKFEKKFQKSIYLTKSFSFSTLCNKSSSLVSSIKYNDHLLTKSYSYSNRSLLIILILILSFLITNTIDIVLFYVYFHTNYIHLISFISIFILCDMILWINNLIRLNTIPSCLLLIPFSIRPYLLYELVELLTIIFDKNFNRQILNSSSSSSSSSTTTAFETNVSRRTDSSMIHYLSFYNIKKQRLFHYLTLFYVVHTGLLTFINVYFWSNNFQQPTTSRLNINYFIPQWISHNDYLLSTSTIKTVPRYPSIASKFQHQQNTMFLQIIFSLITHYSIDDISINALISLENLCIFLYRLYLETFSFSHNETTLSLIIFISILMSLQIIGFIFDILSKSIFYQTKPITI
ncbi:unnamed protein product [Rotaria sp. Silwood1]|nr:unnamed protein product [Rotaria sp. Silwood1]CAF4499673.1 unnamed protein product [Rotaria sp. Silwood1]